VIVIGEAPPRTAPANHEALSGASGRRLADLAGLSWAAWLALDRRNLLPRYYEPWDRALAATAALEVISEHPDALLLLGRRVAAAFGITSPPLTRLRDEVWGTDVLLVPHPSGRCRWWNDPDNAAAARGALRWFLDPPTTPL
jgi:uracil-DNA glycosylase